MPLREEEGPMSLVKDLDKLEAARESLEASAESALKTLPGRSGLPAALRPEWDMVAAQARRELGFFKRAEILYARVLASREAEPFTKAEAALGSAAGLRSLGRSKQAASRLDAARRFAADCGQSGHFKDAIELEAAMIDRAAGRLGASLRRLRPMLRRAEASGDLGGAAFLLWAIGGAERLRGRLRESEASFLRSLKLARKGGDAAGAGYAMFGLGGTTRVRGKAAESERWYSKASTVFRGSEDNFARAYACCGRANALRQLGRLDEALRLYREAYRLYASIEDFVDLAFVDWGIGEIEMRRGGLRSSLKRFSEAERVFAGHDEVRGRCLCLFSMAKARYCLGQRAAADKLYAKGFTLARSHGLRTYMEVFT